MKQRFFLFTLVLSVAAVLIRDYVPFGIWAVPAIIAVCAVLAAVRKDCFYLISALIVCIVSVSYFRVAVNYRALDGVSGTGKVIKCESYRIEISDTLLENERCNKAYVYCDGEAFRVGDIIEFSGAKCEPVKESGNNPGQRQAVRGIVADGYSYRITPEEITVTGHKTGINEIFNTVREKIYNKIAYVIDDSDTCGVLYAMFTGDRRYVSDYVYGLFASSGTAHLLAVSGLHVSVLLSFAVSILKKLRAKPIIMGASVGIFLLFYLFLTGFSPSVVRASVMALASITAMLFGMRYDSLSSLCFAACAIIAVNPYRIYDISFQLSFSACFGIITFYKPSKTLAGEILLSPIKLTAATTLSTLPFVLYSIGKISLFTVLGNFILVPMATLSLNLLFVCLIVAFILPFMNFMLYLPYAAGYFMLWTARFFDSARQFTFMYISGISVIALAAVLYFFSRFCKAPHKFKRAAAVAAAFAVFGYSVYCGADLRNSAKIRVVEAGDGICVHIRQNGNYIVGLTDNENVSEYLAHNISYIDAVAVINEATAEQTERISDYPIDTVYSLLTLNGNFKQARLYDGETVKMGDGTLTLGDSWAIYSYNGHGVFIGEYPNREQAERCDVFVLNAGTVLVKDKVYHTDVSGCVTVDLKNDLRTEGVRK